MNILDILILLILGFSVLAGMYKGFFASLFATLGFVGSWFGARMLYERIANLALSNTTLMAVLNQYLEPETFFESITQAKMTVAEIVSGGEATIGAAVSGIGEKMPLFAKAFEANVRNQAFAKLNISTLAEYLDQTIWQAVFNLLAFLVAFILIYAIVSLIVNLLDNVLHFPVLRLFDWLPGGLLGLVRGLVVVVLLLCIVPSIVTLISPDTMQSLIDESRLYSFIRQLDFLNVSSTVTQLIG